MARVIVSGGGTGGHVFPAIAIADELKKRAPETELLFVGAQGKIEMEKVPKAGYPIKGLWISGFHRKLTLRNMAFPFKLISSLWKSYWIVRNFKPDVAVGTGGFASGPVLQMANMLGVPTLLQEQNSYAGITNKLLAAKADKICVAYDKMERYFPAEKIVITGNPVRSDITSGKADRQQAFAHFGFDPAKPCIILVGGSLGAKSLNEAMRASYDQLKAQPEIQVLWQCGKLYIEAFAESATAKLPQIKASAFIDRMDLAYAMADVVIARSGASTISELCIAGKATVLVPSPNVAEDHQTKNAQALVEKDAAVLVKDKEANEMLIASTIDLINDKSRVEQLERNISKLAKPAAAQHIAEEVLKLIAQTSH